MTDILARVRADAPFCAGEWITASYERVPGTQPILSWSEHGPEDYASIDLWWDDTQAEDARGAALYLTEDGDPVPGHHIELVEVEDRTVDGAPVVLRVVKERLDPEPEARVVLRLTERETDEVAAALQYLIVQPHVSPERRDILAALTNRIAAELHNR